MRKLWNPDELTIIVPMSIEIDWTTKDEAIASMRLFKNKYGYDKFALALPCGGWRSIGYPPHDYFREKGELFREIRQEVEKDGIVCGWWNTLTINTGESYEFIRLIDIDGNPAPISSCPLDPHFRERFAKDNALFAKVGKPAFMFVEDDYAISSHSKGGCFCQYHLAEFARREGRYYSREGLKTILARKTPESFELLRRWRDLQRDSLVGLSEAVRAELDKETPEIPMGLAQCASPCDADGDSTEAISRAFAGPNHTPFCRIQGSYYNGGETLDIPRMMYHPLYNKQHIKGDFYFMQEADAYPQTRYFNSAAHMRAIMEVAYSFGFESSLFYPKQILDDVDEEKAYSRMFVNERAKFSEIFRTARGCRLRGVKLCFDPFWNTAAPEGGNWIRCVGLFGIPYTTTEDNVIFLDACTARHAEDGQLKKWFSKGLFLDGDAAKVLCERGYSQYIGVDVGEDITLSGMLKYDLAAREVILPPFDRFSKGKHMPSPHMFSNGHNGIARRLCPINPAVEIITEEVSYEKKSVSPLMTRFVNTLGGHIVVMGMTLTDNRSQSLFNYRRQRLFQELLKWCTDEYAFVKNDADIFTIMNVAEKPGEKGFRCLLTLTNLCDDPLDAVSMHLPKALYAPVKVLLLEKTGKWRQADYKCTEDGIEIKEKLEYCDPMIVKII